MMRNIKAFLSVLCFGMSVGVAAIHAEETAPSGDVSLATTIDATQALPALPSIPWRIVAQQVSPRNAEQLGLSQQQRDDLQKLMTTNLEQVRALQTLKGELQSLQVTSFRIEQAFKGLEAETEADALAEALRILTAEQQAQIRQTNRLQIQQVSHTLEQMDRPRQPFGVTLESQLSNRDLLSALELPEVQQSLMITDQQWQQIEAARLDAQAAARRLILQLAELQKQQFPTPDVDLTSHLPEFGEQTMSLLTDPQAEKYRQLVAARQKSLEERNAGQRFKPVFEHGRVIRIQTQTSNTEVKVSVELLNTFDDPEIRRELDLTPEQTAAITAQLQALSTQIEEQLAEQTRAGQTAQARRREQLKELVVAHNAIYDQQLAPILTETQTVQLKREGWKSLGWRSLLKPEVAELLQLSDEQTAAIQAVLNTPFPMRPQPSAPRSFEEFKQRSDDFHRKATEHSRSIATGIWNVLTPDQRQELTALTGLKPPATVTP